MCCEGVIDVFYFGDFCFVSGFQVYEVIKMFEQVGVVVWFDVGDIFQFVGYLCFLVVFMVVGDGEVVCFVVNLLDELQCWVGCVWVQFVVIGYYQCFVVGVVFYVFGYVYQQYVFYVQVGQCGLCLCQLFCVVVDQQYVWQYVLFFYCMVEVVVDGLVYGGVVIVWFDVVDVEVVILCVYWIGGVEYYV